MATNLQTTAAHNPMLSGIPSSPISPVVPEWVSASDLDADNFYMPTLHRGQEVDLRKSASAHLAALRPSAYGERETILGELRLRTIPRTESAEEAMARQRCLLDDLADVPADILRAACNAYVNEPGTRFYPTAGELRGFVNPLIHQRRTRASRLSQMADNAAHAIDPNEIWKPGPGETAAVLAEFGVPSAFSAPEAEREIPTVEAYMDVCGITRAEAEKIVAKQTAAARDQSIGKALTA